MLLVFMLVILAQYLHYQDIFVLEEIQKRKDRVAQRVDSLDAFWSGIRLEAVDEDGLHQRIRVAGELVFRSCRDDLTTDGQALLEDIGTILKTHRNFFQSVQVEGHADRRGAAGCSEVASGVEDNWQLSARRATEVVRLFSSSQVLPGEVLSSVGRGQFQPLSEPTDTSTAALERDRRIEIVLRYSEEDASRGFEGSGG